MTAPALDLFVDAPEASARGLSESEARSATWYCRSAPRCDVVKLAVSDAEIAELVRIGPRISRRRCTCDRLMDLGWSVDCEPMNCALCDQVIKPSAKEHMVAFIEGQPHWAHTMCGVRVMGRETRTRGYRDRAEQPPCARVECAQPWERHASYGYVTKSCPGDDASILYEHAIGHVGPIRPQYVWEGAGDPCACELARAA